MVRRYVDLDGARVLDIGCGIGTYVRAVPRSTATRSTASRSRPTAWPRRAWSCPTSSWPSARRCPSRRPFDLVFSNEVIEHVDDDRQTIAEAVRVTRPGGSIVAFAPNRLYPFETHGAYIGGRYVFGNIPLVNWLPDPLRDRFVPHVRAYTAQASGAVPGPAGAARPPRRHLPGLRQHHRPPRPPGPPAAPRASTSPSDTRSRPSACPTSSCCASSAGRPLACRHRALRRIAIRPDDVTGRDAADIVSSPTLEVVGRRRAGRRRHPDRDDERG